MLQYKRGNGAAMTSEELQRAMEFMVDQQAKSSAKIEALIESQKESDGRFKRTEEGIRSLLAIAEIHEREINTIGHQVSSVSRDVATLSETTRATDERLNTLINVVERQISNGRNGRS